MFDIGFAELVLVGIIGLLVLGPERLPVAIRHAGLWIGRLKRSYRHIRADIEREIGADDIRRQLHNEEVMQSLNASKEELQKLSELEQSAPSIGDNAGLNKPDDSQSAANEKPNKPQ
jgi:sec-independent protein translocase protein TatB